MRWTCRLGLHGKSRLTVVRHGECAIYEYRCRDCGSLVDYDVYDPNEAGVWGAFWPEKTQQRPGQK